MPPSLTFSVWGVVLTGRFVRLSDSTPLTNEPLGRALLSSNPDGGRPLGTRFLFASSRLTVKAMVAVASVAD